MASGKRQKEAETSEGGTGPRISDDQVIARIQSATKGQSSPPVLSTSDVANLLPIGDEATRKRLNNLEEENRLQKYKAGRNPVWWPSAEEDGGEVQGADLNLEDINLTEEDYRDIIDSSEIPEDVARQAALEKLDYQQANGWEEMASSGKTTGTFGFGLFFLILLASESSLLQMSGIFNTISVAGVFLALVGSIMWTVGAAGDKIKRRVEIYRKVRSRITSLRSRAKETIEIWTQ